MKAILNKIKFVALYIAAFVPTRLPIGVTEYQQWANSIIYLSGLPDNDSIRFALASTVPHQKAEKAWVAKIKFVNLLLKAAANQVAGSIMVELKENHQKRVAEEEAAAKQQAEATPPTSSGEHKYQDI